MAFAGGIAVAALALGAMVVHRHVATRPPAKAVAASSPAAAAMRVAIDPETGTLGLPTSEEAQGLDLPAEPQGQAPVRVLAGGTIQVDLRGRARNYAVARLGADGRVATDCVTNATTARRFLLGAGADTNRVDGRDMK